MTANTSNYSPQIVVADDDPLCRYFIKFLMELELGITPLLAASGQQALDLLGQHKVDILITDLCMPKISGRDLLRQVVKLHPETKVIVISGDFHMFGVQPSELMREGALDAINKDEVARITPMIRKLRNIP